MTVYLDHQCLDQAGDILQKSRVHILKGVIKTAVPTLTGVNRGHWLWNVGIGGRHPCRRNCSVQLVIIWGTNVVTCVIVVHLKGSSPQVLWGVAIQTHTIIVAVTVAINIIVMLKLGHVLKVRNGIRGGYLLYAQRRLRFWSSHTGRHLL